ncbi:MAG TPA: hypothetical protein VFO70_08215 [Chitinophagaceae bacterium]|nr:hypothetical protein [Chitinophagaceae bacterium]
MKIFLFILVSFIAVTSTLSGLLMLSDPDGGLLTLPLSLLEGTPFQNYLFPGVLLAGLVGGVNIVAVYSYIARTKSRYNWSIAGGSMIIGWIIVQMILIQSVHWLHFIYLGAGVLIILISYQLKGKWAV